MYNRDASIYNKKKLILKKWNAYTNSWYQDTLDMLE